VRIALQLNTYEGPMDQPQPPTPTTPASQQETPNSGNTATQAARRLFETAAPPKRPPSAIPPTEQVKQATVDSLTDVNNEIHGVKHFVKAQIGDLHDQVSALGQQMATLMSLMAQQQSNPTTTQVPATLGAIPATLGAKATSIAVSSNSGDAKSTATAVASNSGDATHQIYTASSPSNSGAAAVHSPSSVMLSNHLYRKTDQQMYENCQDLKPKPSNPSIALSAFKRIKPTVIQAIHEIKHPGIQADIAISTFISELKAVLNSPADHTIASLVTEALITGSKTTESTTQNLLRLAVKCGSFEEIQLQAEKVRHTGRYNRSMASLADVTQNPSYDNFNPETDQGKHLWTAILDLLLAYWKRPKSAQADQQALETEYKNLSCIDPAETSTYLTAESELYTKLQSAHIIYSDQTRVRALLANCSSQIQSSYQSFKKRKKEDNQWDHLHETDVNIFAQDLETVTDAMDPTDTQDTDPGQHHQTPHKPRRSDTNPDPREHRDRPCWDHQYTAAGCGRGEHCPWEHVGGSGEKKLRYATEEGACRAFLLGTCDRGTQCKFTHPPKTPPAGSEDHLNGPGKRDCVYYKNGSCQYGDQRTFLHRDPKPTAMHARPDDSSDSSDDDSDLYESY
jgi:hypothetical protein